MARILIAEDEKPISDLIKFNLELVGHICTQVFSGEATLDAALSGKFDLLILDVMLPQLSGFEIIGQLQDLPVIFVTARSGIHDRLRGLRTVYKTGYRLEI